MYQKRMNSYYPQVIQCIAEFKAIIDAEYPEIEKLSDGVQRVIDDAYLLTMSEERITEWETMLSIKPLPDSTLEDRRDVIIARIRGQGKLNTALINKIVNTFTGGTARSWVANSCLYVEITPPPNNKQYRFENVEQELKIKQPAHLGFKCSRNYYEWNELRKLIETWGDVYEYFDTWEDVFLYVPFEE